MNAPVTNLPVVAERKSILMAMASRYSMEPAAFEATLRATVVPANCSREQFAACLVVANEYRLNPLTKEIYFFPARGGGIVPVVGVDGWCRIINEHPGFDGMEFDVEFAPDGKPLSTTCRMYRKDRNRPTSITEYFSECARPTDPWRQAPARMLRHKAMIQGARYAFGFTGIYDQDEAERIAAADARDVTPRPASSRPPSPPAQATDAVQQIEHQAPIILEMARETVAAETAATSRPPSPPATKTASTPAKAEPALTADGFVDKSAAIADFETQLAAATSPEIIEEIRESFADHFDGMSRQENHHCQNLYDDALARVAT